MTVSEIATATGLSRQKVYELRDRFAANPENHEVRVLTQLAAEGGLSEDALSERLELPAGQVAGIVQRLRQGKLVSDLITFYHGKKSESWVRMTPEGEVVLQQWLTHDRELPRMVVYAVLDPKDRHELSDAAVDFFGAESFAVIEPGTVRSQEHPELAFHVAAGDVHEAVSRGRERLAELRRIANLPPAEALISAVAPADPWRPHFEPVGTAE